MGTFVVVTLAVIAGVFAKLQDETGLPFDFYNPLGLAEVVEQLRGKLSAGSRALLGLNSEVDFVSTDDYALVVAAATAGTDLLAGKSVAILGEGDMLAGYWPEHWLATLPVVSVASAATGALKGTDFVIIGDDVEAKDLEALKGALPATLTPAVWVSLVVAESKPTADGLVAMLTLMGGTETKPGVWEVRRGRDTLVVDLGARTIQGKALKRAFYLEGLDGVTGDATKALYWALWFALAGESGATGKGRLAYTTNLYLDPGHGEVREGIAKLRFDYELGCLRALPGDGSLELVITNGDTTEVLAACHALNKAGIPWLPKHQGDGVYYGIGAQAMGVTLAGSLVLGATPHHTKTEKVLNRFPLNKGSVDTVLVDARGQVVSGMVDSPIRTRLADGSLTSYHGLKVRAVVAGDCPLLNDGSGTAIVMDKVLFKTSTPVTLTAAVNVAGLTEEEALAWVRDGIVITPRVTPGLHAIDFDGAQYALNPAHSTATWQADPDSLALAYDAKFEQVKATVAAVEVNYARSAKLAKNGLKAVARPNPKVTIWGVDGQVLCGPEALKGLFEIYLEMALYAAGETLVRTPEELQPEAAKKLVDEFLAANGATATVGYDLGTNPSEYARLKADYAGLPGFTFLDDANTIVWEGTVWAGDIVVAVENTPIYKSIGKATTTPEMLLAQSLVCPELAAHRVEAKGYKARAYRMQRFMAAVCGVDDAPKNAPVLDPVAMTVLRPNGQVLALAVPNVDAGTSDRDLFARLAKAFPDGLVVRFENQDLYLDLEALEALAPLDENGSGYGYARELVSWFRAVGRQAAGTFKGDFTRRTANFVNLCRRHLASAVADAPKTMAKVLRPAAVQVSKVTTFSWVPQGVMAVNPRDPRVVDGTWTQGMTVVNYRCPVYFGAAYTLWVTPLAPVGLPAVNPLDWAANNSGDADGDQVFTEKVPEALGLVVQKAYANAGWLGPEAYFLKAGVERAAILAGESVSGLPFYDFVKPEGAKKGEAAHVFGTPDAKGGLDLFGCTREAFLETATNVVAQYKVRVGLFYGMKQAALWMALATTHVDGNVPQDIVVAARKVLAICGSLYEDLGLAGYSAKAQVFGDALAQLVKDEGVLVVDGAKADLRERYLAYPTQKKAVVPEGAKVLGNIEGIKLLLDVCLGITATDLEAKLVLRARQINICYRDVEIARHEIRHGGDLFLGRPLLTFATLVGAMRRASKGILAGDSIVADILGDQTEMGFGDRQTLAQTALEDQAAVKYFFGKCPVTTGMVFRALNLAAGAAKARVNELDRLAGMAW